jgi:hypothetical protein
MAITLEEAYEIIRRYRPDMRLHRDHVCDVVENADRHKLVDCPCDYPAVYTTSDALSDIGPTLETRLQTGQSLRPL